MGFTESDTRAKLIDPAIHSRGWTEEHIHREETAGAVEIIDGKPRKKAKGRVDYVLRLTASPDSQPVAIAIIEAKAEHLPPNHGLEQAKAYSACKRMNVQFVFSSNGHLFVEYDMSQGIEDGYLAACEIQKGRVNLDQAGLTKDQIMARNPRNAITGAPITREEANELYEKTTFEKQLLLPDRVMAMCKDFFQFLVDSGAPEQKTIIFCARDSHADDVAAAMNNLYVDWCQKHTRQPLASFAFKCTAAGGKDNLPELRGASRSHFIATTVELLTTGVDVPCLQNIVFFKYVRSPISFYQMIGRGTRLDPPTGKLMFRIYDYTNATDLFGRTFITKKPREGGGGGGTEPPLQIIVEGFDIRVTPAGHFILTNVDGRAVPVTIEEYKERLAKRLVEEIKTITEFRECWISPKWRREILGRLPEAGRSPILVQRLDEMEDFDLFDVLGELGYGLLPKTRIQRTEAFYYKHQPWLSSLPPQACNTLSALVKVFSHSGTDGLESPAIFHTPEIAKAGGLKALRIMGKPSEILKETKLRIFAA